MHDTAAQADVGEHLHGLREYLHQGHEPKRLRKQQSGHDQIAAQPQHLTQTMACNRPNRAVNGS